MGIYFGTDGIRGVVCDELTYNLAYKCGNALGGIKEKANILIGRDTRTSGAYLTNAFAGGAMSAGANVVDIGVCTTPGIAYLTKKLGFDYGVVISASHNPAKYNGIKIYTRDGIKLSDERENHLERKFAREINLPYDKIGSYKQNFALVHIYEDYLVSCAQARLDGLKIVIDASNGASNKIAPRVLRALGATVIKINCCDDGKNINNNCGSLFPDALCRKVIGVKADMGFAFDGDADRIIACDENGNIIDGDMIIFMLAKHLKSLNKLTKNTVVGTTHTNIGIEKSLSRLGISLERTDIGDKYVIAKMVERGLNLGGEKSGHIILRDYATTGDGLLTAIKLAEMVVLNKKKFSELAKIKLLPQSNIDVVVGDKMRIINSEKLGEVIDRERVCLGEKSRIMVRVSGTEPKIRIMTECPNANKARLSALEIEKAVKEIEERG